MPSQCSPPIYRSDDDGFQIVNRLRRKKAFDGAHHHERDDNQKKSGAGEPSKYLNFLGAKCKAAIPCKFSGRSVGKGSQSDSDGVRTLMKAIGQQRHRVVPPAGGNFDGHHDRGNPHYGSRAAFASQVNRVERVVVSSSVQVMGVRSQILKFADVEHCRRCDAVMQPIPHIEIRVHLGIQPPVKCSISMVAPMPISIMPPTTSALLPATAPNTRPTMTPMVTKTKVVKPMAAATG